MRAGLFLIACLSVTACVSADFSLGNPEDGDILVVQRNITKPPIPVLPTIVKLGATAPPGSVIAYVSVEDLGNDTSSSTVFIGGIGAAKVLLLTRANAGEVLDIEFTVYAKSLPTTTVEPPPETTTTTAEPPTPRPTTAGTSTSHGPTTTTAAPNTGGPAEPAGPTDGPSTPSSGTDGPAADTSGTAGPSTAGPSTSDDDY